MTALIRTRFNTVLALALPAGGFLYLTSSGSQHPAAVAVTLALGTLWLAAVVALNTLPMDRESRVVHGVRNLTDAPTPGRLGAPAYVMDVSEPVPLWRWTDVLVAPLELLAVAWSVPVVILSIMLPIGLALATALWLSRFILDLF